MSKLLDQFNNNQLKQLPDLRPGDTVKIHQKIQEKGKERIQIFEGVVIAKKHGTGTSATITVRKIASGVGVERIFPIHSPAIDKIEVVKHGKVARAKLYYLRTAKGRKAKLKKKEFAEVIADEEPKMQEEQPSEQVEEKPAEADQSAQEAPTEASEEK